MVDVFVSYARSDKALVAPLVAALEAQGWSVWWDPAIAPGQEFDIQIAAELRSAAAVLVVWTRQSVDSRWVRGEARDAADRGILVPVRFGEVELPIDFRALHTADLIEAADATHSTSFLDVVRALGALIARHTRPLAEAASVEPPSALVSGPASRPVRVAICVLPLSNLSGDAEQQAFSDGISEDIITELSRTP
jgi:adenylate cyclase